MTVAFRPADLSEREGSDRVFVISNWVASFRIAHAAGIVPMDLWHDFMWRVCGRLIDRPDAQTLVAEEDGALYGFLSFEPPAPRARWRAGAGSSPSLDGLPFVYYAYTKEAWRRARGRLLKTGVMSGLLDAAGIGLDRQLGYACKTMSVVQLMDAGKIPGARWDPLRARFTREAPR